jgi:mono/diheme cytochrome c family protein
MRLTWPIRSAAVLAGAALLIFVSNPRVAAFQNPEPHNVDFATEVQPIFEKSCGNCHGPKMQMSGLRLDTKAGAFAGGENGKVILPGRSDESPLYQRIAGLAGLIPMPMGGKRLDPAQIATIKAWIDQGAEWPDSVGAQVESVKKHWAFIPPVRHDPSSARLRSYKADLQIPGS